MGHLVQTNSSFLMFRMVFRFVFVCFFVFCMCVCVCLKLDCLICSRGLSLYRLYDLDSLTLNFYFVDTNFTIPRSFNVSVVPFCLPVTLVSILLRFSLSFYLQCNFCDIIFISYEKLPEIICVSVVRFSLPVTFVSLLLRLFVNFSLQRIFL